MLSDKMVITNGRDRFGYVRHVRCIGEQAGCVPRNGNRTAMRPAESLRGSRALVYGHKMVRRL